MVRRVAVVVLVVLAAAACGSRQGEAVVDTNIDAHALADAVDHTAAAGTGKVHVTITTTDATGSGSSSDEDNMTGEGAYDRASGLSSMSSTSAAHPDQRQQVVQHGDVTYFQADGSFGLASLDPSFTGKWIKIDLSSLGAKGGLSSMLGGWNPMGDPSAVLDYLKGAGADVTTVGTETIDGVDTTHVHAALSMQQAIAAAGDRGDEVSKSLEGLPGGSGDALAKAVLPVDLYIDADHNVRRITLSFDKGGPFDDADGSSTSLPGAGSGPTTTVTLEYYDLGQPVSIVEPAPADVVSMCDMFSALASKMPAGMVPPSTAPLPGC